MKELKELLIFAGIVVGILMLFAIPEMLKPNTSANVTVVDDNVVRLPEQSKAVFDEHHVVPINTRWALEIKYDGVRVTSSCLPLCPTAELTVGDAGQEQTLVNGYPMSNVTVTKQSDGSVHVRWPIGMSLRN